MDGDNRGQDHIRPMGRVIGRSSRRVFIRRVIGGLAIAVPAFGALLKSSPAPAETLHASGALTPGSGPRQINPCGPGNTYTVYEGHKCQPYGISTCPAPPGGGTCIGYYSVYSRVDGTLCSTYTDNEGPCRG
jgi:hypothetical protein